MCQSVNQTVCLLHTSKTMKPLSLKLCMHTKGTPRECTSEYWVFALIKTLLLKIMSGLIYLYSLSGAFSATSLSLEGHPRLPRWGVNLPFFLACSTMPRLGTGHNDFFTIVFFPLSSFILLRPRAPRHQLVTQGD